MVEFNLIFKGIGHLVPVFRWAGQEAVDHFVQSDRRRNAPKITGSSHTGSVSFKAESIYIRLTSLGKETMLKV